jgi:aminoglycoside phosphotransferase (APT) family kinase protein
VSEFLDKTRTMRSGEELDLARLEAYLREHLPGVAGALSIEQFPAGHSNLTYSVRLGELDMVLRRPPFGSKVKSAHDMGREYRVLSKLHKVFTPAPEPVLYCEDDAVLGAPFYLMKRIRGVIIRRDPPAGLDFSPSVARRLGESFVDTLAALHALDYEAIGLGDLGKPHGYMQRQVEGWIKRYYGSQTHDIAEVEPISRWMTEHISPEIPASLIHNDYKYDNTIVAADDITRIIGVLDWEMCTLGDPLSDLGTAICYWINADDPPEMQLIRWAPTTVPGTLTRQELVARYAEKTGRDTSGMVFYYVYALFKTAVIAQQIYYRYHHGLTKDERFVAFLEAGKIMMRASLRAAETGTY